MEPIIFLAQFWGWFMLLSGVMLLLGGKVFINELVEVTKNRGFIILAGFFALALGLATLILHQTWTTDWAGVVTTLGWLAVVGGVVRIMMPNFVRSMLRWFTVNLWVVYGVAFFCIALGIGLLQFSW